MSQTDISVLLKSNPFTWYDAKDLEKLIGIGIQSIRRNLAKLTKDNKVDRKSERSRTGNGRVYLYRWNA